VIVSRPPTHYVKSRISAVAFSVASAPGSCGAPRPSREITSGGRGPRTGRTLPESIDVGYPPGTRATVCRSHPTNSAMRVLNCPCCLWNRIAVRAMAESTLHPSVGGLTRHGDGAPAGGCAGSSRESTACSASPSSYGCRRSSATHLSATRGRGRDRCCGPARLRNVDLPPIAAVACWQRCANRRHHTLF